MNKNIQTILDMLESNTFQKGVLLDILKSYGEDIKSFFGWWRTEDEIKQVVAALRSALTSK